MPSDPPRYKTPTEHRGIYETIVGSPAFLNREDGSIWEKDRARHGGAQWKRWPRRKAWENGDTPMSVWPDGRIRK